MFIYIVMVKICHFFGDEVMSLFPVFFISRVGRITTRGF